MRIGLNTPDPQATATEKTKKSSGSAAHSAEETGLKEKADLTQDRVTLSALATQAMGTPEVRQEKVDSLRQSISSGQYQLDSNESAEAILRP